MIVEITNSNEKQAIARKVLEALTDWFEIEESREEYISGCVDWTFFANLFYISCGFKELEVFPLLWDDANPCQIYVMSLK